MLKLDYFVMIAIGNGFCFVKFGSALHIARPASTRLLNQASAEKNKEAAN